MSLVRTKLSLGTKPLEVENAKFGEQFVIPTQIRNGQTFINCWLNQSRLSGPTVAKSVITCGG